MNVFEFERGRPLERLVQTKADKGIKKDSAMKIQRVCLICQTWTITFLSKKKDKKTRGFSEP